MTDLVLLSKDYYYIALLYWTSITITRTLLHKNDNSEYSIEIIKSICIYLLYCYVYHFPVRVGFSYEHGFISIILFIDMIYKYLFFLFNDLVSF